MTVKRFTEGNKPKEANLKKKSTINLKQFQFIDVDQAQQNRKKNRKEERQSRQQAALEQFEGGVTNVNDIQVEMPSSVAGTLLRRQPTIIHNEKYQGTVLLQDESEVDDDEVLNESHTEYKELEVDEQLEVLFAKLQKMKTPEESSMPFENYREEDATTNIDFKHEQIRASKMININALNQNVTHKNWGQKSAVTEQPK